MLSRRACDWLSVDHVAIALRASTCVYESSRGAEAQIRDARSERLVPWPRGVDSARVVVVPGDQVDLSALEQLAERRRD
jgi:hypothetical protein